MKRIRNKFGLANYKELLAYLEEMKQDGWILKKVSPAWLTFEEGNGDNVYYLADIYEQYDETVSYYISKKKFIQKHKEQGLEYFGRMGVLYIFEGSKSESSFSQKELREKVIGLLKEEYRGNKLFLGYILSFSVITMFRILSKAKEEVSFFQSLFNFSGVSYVVMVLMILSFLVSVILRIARLKKAIRIYENSLESVEKLPYTNYVFSTVAKICILMFCFNMLRDM